MSELYTPYQAAKLVNAVLDEHGIKNIPPQMMYNYVGKGYIESTLVDGKKKVTLESVQSWLIKYLEKKGIKLETDENVETEVHEDQLELDITETTK